MRKLFLVSLMFLMMCLFIENAQANDYSTFQDIEFEHKGAKLLENYANSDYKKYYNKLGKKRFWGWRTYIVYEDEECHFVRETLYVIINDGDTAIDDTISFERGETVKRHYSATGSLEVGANGTLKGFKLGLEQEIGTEQTKTVTQSFEEKYTVKIKVDPQTKLIISISGEGKVSNGVGKYYRFYKNVKKGGWEIFTVTTEYYCIEKIRI